MKLWLMMGILIEGCAGWMVPVPLSRSVTTVSPLTVGASGAPKRRRRKRMNEEKEIKQEIDDIPATVTPPPDVEEEEDTSLLKTSTPEEVEDDFTSVTTIEATGPATTTTTTREEEVEDDMSLVTTLATTTATATEPRTVVPSEPDPLPESWTTGDTKKKKSKSVKIKMPRLEARPLLEDLPVPSEGRMDLDAAEVSMGLPKLEKVAARSAEKKKKGQEPKTQKKRRQIEKFDREAYIRAIEIDPNADADPDLFKQDGVDLFAIVLGEKADKFFGIESAYLQVGHGALALVLVLAAFVYEPNFPLTDSPIEYRSWLQQGLLVTYLINIGVAALAFLEAGKRDQPQLFWLVKSFFLGGVALNQLRTGTKIPDDR